MVVLVVEDSMANPKPCCVCYLHYLIILQTTCVKWVGEYLP